MRFDHKRIERRSALLILTVGALSIVIVLIAAGVSSCVDFTGSANDHSVVYERDDAWTPPHQTFLQSPMHTTPVPGWRLTAQDLGLPPADSPIGRPQIGNPPDPYPSDPFVGYLGDHAYFLASSAARETHWWLAAIDVRKGEGLFPPIPLGTGTRPACFLNGPDALLCLAGGNDPQAWVIDAHSGHVEYSGETDLTLSPGHMGVDQVGIYAVAGDMDVGLYGVGDRAQTTWFVPGEGRVSHYWSYESPDVEPPMLAAQTVTGRGALRMQVFSLIDGTVLQPEIEAGFNAEGAVVYPGGFAVESGKGMAPDRLSFYDETGRLLRTVESPGFLDVNYGSLPIAGGGTDGTVFSSEGYLLARITGFDSGSAPQQIGSFLFVSQSGVVDHWAQYDLRTGEELRQCDSVTSLYVGSDGEVGIFSDGDPRIPQETRAVDLATCTVNWTLTSPPGSFRRVWRINTTLVQLSDDGTELMSLVAPS